jgi:hypothetical protein
VLKCRNFDLADDICNKLRNKSVVGINDGSKEWMAVTSRGGW